MSSPKFGVTNETKSNNATPFSPRFTKGYLTKVEFEEIGKDEKYNILAFYFADAENIKTFKHIEWIVKPDAENFDKKMNGMNVRIKHIYECFQKFPESGIGISAKTFEEFFVMVVKAFNEGRDGKRIYTSESAEKQIPILIWIKTGYNNRGEINFPLSPNFVERIGSLNQSEPKTLTWDKRYDRDEQPNKKGTSTENPGIMGGGASQTANTDFEF